MLAGMWPPRLERLDVLLSRIDRPGGMYPPLALASVQVSADECDAMDERMRRSALGDVWVVWRDASRSAADRAMAIAALDPSVAHVHLLLADLFLRDEDAHAEPCPELRTSIASLRPALGYAYARLLEGLKDDFDHDGEQHEARRGFGHSADEATPLLETASERACFARGRMAWGSSVAPALHPDLLAEIVERRLVHTPGGASAQLSIEGLASLECPELLTSLHLWGQGLAATLPQLVRAKGLRELTLAVPEHDRDLAHASALATLPIESLTLELSARPPPPWPCWIAEISSLRSLALRYTDRGTDGGAVAIPAEISSIERLEALSLSGVGSLPDDLGRLASLRALEIRGWKLVGLPRSTKLERLSVDPVLALPGVPEGFERLTALRDLRLGHLDTPELPRVLLRMPWLTRVHLIAARRWPAAQEAELRAALPAAYVSVAFTGNARP
jgi:hypothetical protein